MDDMTPLFESEMQTFEAHREAWHKTNPSGWVVVRKTTFRGPFDDADDAWRDAIDAGWQPGQFLLKQVTLTDEPVVISHIELPS